MFKFGDLPSKCELSQNVFRKFNPAIETDHVQDFENIKLIKNNSINYKSRICL